MADIYQNSVRNSFKDLVAPVTVQSFRPVEINSKSMAKGTCQKEIESKMKEKPITEQNQDTGGNIGL